MEKVVDRSRSGEMVKIFDKIALVLVCSSHMNLRSECSSGTVLNCFLLGLKPPNGLQEPQERSERCFEWILEVN